MNRQIETDERTARKMSKMTHIKMNKSSKTDMNNKNISKPLHDHTTNQVNYAFTGSDIESLQELCWLSEECLRRKLLENGMEIPESLAEYDEQNVVYEVSESEMDKIQSACQILEQRKGRKCKPLSEREMEALANACWILGQRRTREFL